MRSVVRKQKLLSLYGVCVQIDLRQWVLNTVRTLVILKQRDLC